MNRRMHNYILGIDKARYAETPAEERREAAAYVRGQARVLKAAGQHEAAALMSRVANDIVEGKHRKT